VQQAKVFGEASRIAAANPMLTLWLPTASSITHRPVSRDGLLLDSHGRRVTQADA